MSSGRVGIHNAIDDGHNGDIDFIVDTNAAGYPFALLPLTASHWSIGAQAAVPRHMYAPPYSNRLLYCP
jgi:hypothetical protein